MPNISIKYSIKPEIKLYIMLIYEYIILYSY